MVKRVESRRKTDVIRKAAFFSFLWTLAFPQPAMAAEGTLVKTQTYVSESAKEEDRFAKEIMEDGQKYRLVKTECQVVGKEFLDKKEKTVDSETKPRKTIEEGGLKYELVRTETKEELVSAARVETVTAFEDYPSAVTAEMVPKTKTVSVADPETGENREVICEFTGLTETGTSVMETKMTVTYEDYDAAYYEYQGHLIPKNEEQPQIEGCEEQLLAQVGALEGSRITEIHWSGEPYASGGILYRDASATVEQPTKTYRADYKGTYHEEAVKKTIYHGIYEAPDPDGKVLYQMEAKGTYEKIPEKSRMPEIMIATGAGLLLVILAVVITLKVLAKKREEKQ